jgi:hypothetical protein
MRIILLWIAKLTIRKLIRQKRLVFVSTGNKIRYVDKDGDSKLLGYGSFAEQLIEKGSLSSCGIMAVDIVDILLKENKRQNKGG